MRDLAFSPDGRLLATVDAGADAVLLWSMPEGKILRSLPHDEAVTCLAFSGDGRHLATG